MSIKLFGRSEDSAEATSQTQPNAAPTIEDEA